MARYYCETLPRCELQDALTTVIEHSKSGVTADFS